MTLIFTYFIHSAAGMNVDERDDGSDRSYVCAR